jgi:hypothetical protein
MDIPRSGNSLAKFAVLPALFIPIFHAKEADFYFVLAVLLGLMALFVALFWYGFYTRRTPLVRIDETSLTYFGNVKSQQQSFQRCAITGIRLFRRPDFWRSSFRLTVVMDAETVDLWVPYSSGGSVSALREALREQFPDKFEVLT